MSVDGYELGALFSVESEKDDPPGSVQGKNLTQIFDIETGPVDDDELARLLPKFDRESVQDGRCKEETLERKRDEAEARYEERFREMAALSPITGRVLAIGYKCRDVVTFEEGQVIGAEVAILRGFWSVFSDVREFGCSLIGFNISNFDVPFLVRRSWLLNVEVPRGVFVRGRLCDTFVDLYDLWKCGSRFSEPSHVNSKLDTIARFFGLPGKPDGITGADFHRLYADPTTRDQAREYLRNDLTITYEVAKRMGVVK